MLSWAVRDNCHSTVFLLQPAFTLTTKVTFDARTQAMNFIKTLPLDYLMCRIYPRLFALHLLTEKVEEYECVQ